MAAYYTVAVLTLLGVQALGVAAIIAWTAGTVAVSVVVIKAFIPLRVTTEEEIEGLDIAEHGAYAYEIQDMFKGVTSSNDSFAQRLTNLGKPTTNSKVQEKRV